MAKSDLDRDSLKIGDYITLCDANLSCFLSVEGILLEDIVGIDTITSVHDAIFCVHLQRQYSASRELNAFLEKYNMDVKQINEESEIKYLQALERGRDNENSLNDNYMRKKLGQVVLFGDVIQLFHVKSGKYLQVIPGKLAKEERENVRLGLDVNGNAFSWLQICPRFKIDKDGDRILSNVEAYLKVFERGSEFIHSADHNPSAGHDREVNCSLENTSWRINIFQSSTDALDKSLLLASQLVYIHDPETRSNLSVAERKISTLDDEDNDVNEFVELDDEAAEDDGEGEGENSIVLVPSVEGNIDSNFLWFLESSSILVGGPIKWKTEQVRFKHMNTGLYLCQETKYETDADGRSVKTYRYETTDDYSVTNTLFSVNELNSTAKYLATAKACQLGHNGIWMERGDILADSVFTFKLHGTKDQSAAVSLVVNRYNENAGGVGDSAATGSGGGGGGGGEKGAAAGGGGEADDEVEEEAELEEASKEPLDVFVGISARYYLQKYYNMTHFSFNRNSSNTIWPTANRSDMEMFKMIVAKTVIFSQGFPISSTNVKIGIDKADQELRKRRQNLLRQQSTLEVILRMINKLIPMSETTMSAPNAANVDSSFLVKMGRTVLELCFTMLYNAILDNQENQMYVADFMPVLLAHLNTQPVAVKCVTEMLSKNLELQETKIGTREIQIFVDKLRSSSMNAMYLQLLQACCSCQGKGVDGNQCKVANMLFDGDFDDIIIKLDCDYKNARKSFWAGDVSLYLQSSDGSDAKVKGTELLSRGLPSLKLSWQEKSSDGSTTNRSELVETIFSTLELPPTHGKSHDDMDDVDLTYEESVKADSQFKLRKASKSQSPVATMANYFIAEMFLGAEMCLDRNYVAMHRLDDLFPYEVLVTILKMPVSSAVKSAAVRLLMCLHVDRDPQAASKIPLLTRSWGDIKKNPEPQLPYVDPSRRLTFGLIQQMVSEHICGMAGNRWDELSRHMLKMLQTMVRFNFYGTNERMRDVIGPLVQALDRREVDFLEEAGDEGGKSVKIFNLQSSISAKQTSLKKIKPIPESPGGESEMGDEDDGENSSERRSRKKGSGPFSGPQDDDDDSVLSSQAEFRKTIKVQERKQMFRDILAGMDSVVGMMIIMVLVLAEVALLVYLMMLDKHFEFMSPLFIAQAAILLVFVLELSTRLFCQVVTEGSPVSFFTDFFHIIDLIVVVVDIVLFILPTGFTIAANLVIALRLLKLYRLFDLTSARVAAGEEDEVVLDNLTVALRYTKAPIHELETMVEAVDILAFMQKLIEDRNISLMMHYFYMWENGTDRRSPAELFEQVVIDSKELTLDIADFDNVMIDVLMFNHSPLVQSALEVLMAHHSMRTALIANTKHVQLLASAKREKQYRSVNQMLQELEQNAETHELWGELESDEDKESNKRTKFILTELIEICRVRHFLLEFDEEFMADREIQDLYRNLNCFEICMKVMGLLDSVEEDDDGELGEIALNTRHLCLLCNDLLYWFFLGNPLNQELGYVELSFFLDTLDDEINSHRVISAIFKDNETLMRMVPHSHLSDLVDKIVKNGKSHHYLSLFAAISNVGEKNIVENQFEIVKILTSPGRLQKVAWAFVPVDHPEFEEKRELMAPFLDVTKDLSIDDLPPLLAYHLMFLEVLSDCTIGRLNITTVEAKVQSVFNYVDILQSILDPGTITFAKSRLSMFFYNSIIEVELKIPGLEQSAYIWQLLHTYQTVLGYAKDELRMVEKNGWESEGVSRQKIEYIIVCILITGGFFSRYYDPTSFRFNESGSAGSDDKVHITLAQVNDLIISLFQKIKDLYDLDSPRLSQETKEQIFSALESLNKSASKVIVNNLVPNTSKQAAAVRSETLTGEARLVKQFEEFINAISSDEEIVDAAGKENVYFISLMENLPTIMDKVDADVRYETLIRKLVQHIRDNFKITAAQKRLDVRVTKTATWIIRSFRTMIENRMGMSIDERDEEGGQEEDEAAAPVVHALNSCGATTLCLDLIADGIDEALQLEAIRLSVALLFKEGGALEVQGIMNNHLSKTESDLFFKQVRLTLQKLQAWHTWNEVIILEDGEEPSPPDEILIVRMLQLMCEGHYLPNQDIMREQPSNKVSYDLLDDFVNYLNCLSRIPCRTSTVVAIRLSATILEVIQGPCEGNQTHFTLNTELIETLNRLNRAKIVNDCEEDEEVELKKTSIDIFQGLLEGQGEKSVVYERVLSVIHLDIIQMMSKGVLVPESIGEDGKLTVPPEPTEDQEILQTECVVLLQMLCNFKPSLYDELGISKNIDDIVGSGTAMIEVIWRGDIHRRFFHVPGVCEFLAKSSKDSLVENVDRSNSENKLIDFLDRSHDLYREVKHQQLLTEVGVSRIFSRVNQDRATWATFIIAVLINCLFIVYYDYEDEKPRPTVNNTTALAVINAFNLCQNVVALFVLILNLVVRTPVIYQSWEAQDLSRLQIILYTASDPKTMYFFAYLMLSLLGLFAADYYLPFLLLDLVAKNATTRDVLNAVVIPRRQLIMTVVLAIFVTYIFAYFIFKYFRDQLGGLYGDGIDAGSVDCKNLWGCFKFVLCYGLRQGGGVGDVMDLSIGSRWLIDTTYFLVVIVMMLNIIFGIIIDTFSSLRADKNRREEDTEGVCFICGINKQVFDRASDEPDGFKTHVKLDHNMWNYLYFIFMLWEQDKDDDDGLEQYVRRAIDANEIIWFPLNKAIRLDQAASDEEMTLREISREIQEYELSLTKKIVNFQSEMGTMLENISYATKMDHAKGSVKDGISSHLRLTMKANVQNVDDSLVDASTKIGADGRLTLLASIAEEDGSIEEGDGSTVVHDDGSTVSSQQLQRLEEAEEDDDFSDEEDEEEEDEELMMKRLSQPYDSFNAGYTGPPTGVPSLALGGGTIAESGDSAEASTGMDGPQQGQRLPSSDAGAGTLFGVPITLDSAKIPPAIDTRTSPGKDQEETLGFSPTNSSSMDRQNRLTPESGHVVNFEVKYDEKGVDLSQPHSTLELGEGGSLSLIKPEDTPPASSSAVEDPSASMDPPPPSSSIEPAEAAVVGEEGGGQDDADVATKEESMGTAAGADVDAADVDQASSAEPLLNDTAAAVSIVEEETAVPIVEPEVVEEVVEPVMGEAEPSGGEVAEAASAGAGVEGEDVGSLDDASSLGIQIDTDPQSMSAKHVEYLAGDDYVDGLSQQASVASAAAGPVGDVAGDQPSLPRAEGGEEAAGGGGAMEEAVAGPAVPGAEGPTSPVAWETPIAFADSAVVDDDNTAAVAAIAAAAGMSTSDDDNNVDAGSRPQTGLAADGPELHSSDIPAGGGAAAGTSSVIDPAAVVTPAEATAVTTTQVEVHAEPPEVPLAGATGNGATAGTGTSGGDLLLERVPSAIYHDDDVEVDATVGGTNDHEQQHMPHTTVEEESQQQQQQQVEAVTSDPTAAVAPAPSEGENGDTLPPAAAAAQAAEADVDFEAIDGELNDS